MFGAAEEITDRKLRARIYREFGKKYYGSADDPKHIEIWGEVDDPSAVFNGLKPEDGFWWSIDEHPSGYSVDSPGDGLFTHSYRSGSVDSAGKSAQRRRAEL
jgi:hypothetical protein